MGRRRQLDAVGCAATGQTLIRLFKIFVFLVCVSFEVHGQSSYPQASLDSTIKQLFAEQRWQEIVRTLQTVPARSAELDYCYGSALAQMARWEAAREAFLAGYRLQPRDKRFPTELAGVEFKQKNYAQAAAWLRTALRLDPDDTYANEFLATIYFLEGNLEAALKYWNRVAKPEIENVRLVPEPRMNAAMLDHAFAFAPGSTMRVLELLTSEKRIRGLEIFSNHAFDLAAREDGKFDVTFRAKERNGWGNNRWEGLLYTFGGVFYQTITPEFYNLGQSATNSISLLRWDAQKRRLMTSLSGPLLDDPRWRYVVAADLRDENWDIRDSSRAAASPLGALKLRKAAVSAAVSSYQSWRWGWSTGAELSDREYRNVVAGSVLAPDLLSRGYLLKHLAELNYELFRVPERRLTASTSFSSQAGRMWSTPAQSFAKFQGSLALHWLPQSKGDDYELRERIRIGATAGQPPFDELFVLGVERDNDLWLRAHDATRDGRKGSAPTGRRYFLSNWEIDKNVYSNGIFTAKLGPFLDVGKLGDPLQDTTSRKWLWDAGVQTKLRALGVTLVLSYGADLRSGNKLFYATVAH